MPPKDEKKKKGKKDEKKPKKKAGWFSKAESSSSEEEDERFHDFYTMGDSLVVDDDEKCYFCGRAKSDPVHYKGLDQEQLAAAADEVEYDFPDPKKKELMIRVKAGVGDVIFMGGWVGQKKQKDVGSFTGPRVFEMNENVDPQKSIPLRRIVSVYAAGPTGESIFAINAAGLVYAWGKNPGGLLGLGHGAVQKAPEPIVSMKGKCCRKLSVGKTHAVLMTDQFECYTWGKGYCLGHGPYEKNAYSDPKKLDLSLMRFSFKKDKPFHRMLANKYYKGDMKENKNGGDLTNDVAHNLEKVKGEQFSMFDREEDEDSENVGWIKDHRELMNGDRQPILMTVADHRERMQITDVAAGNSMTAVINKLGELIVFGTNANGQLGQGPPTGRRNKKSQNQPQVVQFPPESEKPQQVYAFKNVCYALTSDIGACDEDDMAAEIKLSKKLALDTLKKTMKERRTAFVKKLRDLNNHLKLSLAHNRDLMTKVPPEQFVVDDAGLIQRLQESNGNDLLNMDSGTGDETVMRELMFLEAMSNEFKKNMAEATEQVALNIRIVQGKLKSILLDLEDCEPDRWIDVSRDEARLETQLFSLQKWKQSILDDHDQFEVIYGLVKKMQVERMNQREVYQMSELIKERNFAVADMLVTAKSMRDRLKKSSMEEVEMPSGTTKLAEMAAVSTLHVDKVINDIFTQQTINAENLAEGKGVRYMDNVKSFYLSVLKENAEMQNKLNDMYQVTHDSCMMKTRNDLKRQTLTAQKQMVEARKATKQSPSMPPAAPPRSASPAAMAVE